MIRGADATWTGVVGACGVREPGAGKIDPIGASTGCGVVTGSAWAMAFGVAAMSEPAGMRVPDIGASARILAWSVTVFCSCCWQMTKVVKTASMATALVKAISMNLVVYISRNFINPPLARKTDQDARQNKQ